RVAVIAIGRVEGDQRDRTIVHPVVPFLVALIGAVVAGQLPVAVPLVIGAHHRRRGIGTALGMPVVFMVAQGWEDRRAGGKVTPLARGVTPELIPVQLPTALLHQITGD